MNPPTIPAAPQPLEAAPFRPLDAGWRQWIAENEAGKPVCISRLTVAVIPAERK